MVGQNMQKELLELHSVNCHPRLYTGRQCFDFVCRLCIYQVTGCMHKPAKDESETSCVRKQKHIFEKLLYFGIWRRVHFIPSFLVNYFMRPSHSSGGKSPASHRGGPGSSPVHVIWDLWWTKCYWRQAFSEYFGFPCQFSFHRLLHTPHLSFEAGTTGQIVVEVPSGLSLTPSQETKKSNCFMTLSVSRSHSVHNRIIN
jgi:hypothetical protein